MASIRLAPGPRRSKRLWRRAAVFGGVRSTPTKETDLVQPLDTVLLLGREDARPSHGLLGGGKDIPDRVPDPRAGRWIRGGQASETHLVLEAEFVFAPGQRDLKLAALSLPDCGGCCRGWESDHGGPDTCEKGGIVRCCRQYVPRLGAAFGREARKPSCDVEIGVAGRAPIPIDENRDPVTKAEIVTAHVQVQDVIAFGANRVGCRGKCRKCLLEPRTRPNAGRQEGLGIFLYDMPTPEQLWKCLLRRLSIRRRLRR